MTQLIRSLLILAWTCWLSALALAQAPVTKVDMEALGQEVGRVEAQLDRGGQGDGELQRLRARLDPVMQDIQSALARDLPRLDDVNARLSQIGPKPDDKAPPESAEVARTRAEQEAHKKDLDETIRVARLLIVRVDQAYSAITDRRRALFRQAILERSSSIVSPWLWSDVVQAVPAALGDLRASLSFRFRQIANNLDLQRIGAALILLILGIAAAIPANRILRRWGHRPDSDGAPSRAQRALGALRKAVAPSLLPLALAMVAIAILDILDMGADRFGMLGRVILLAAPILIFLRGLTRGILAPDMPTWRVAPIGNAAAEVLSETLLLILYITVAGKIIEAANLAISAILPFTVAARGVPALAVGVLSLLMLRRVRGLPMDADDNDEMVPPPSIGKAWSRLLPAGLGLLSLTIIFAALTGYIALASFLVDQTLWCLTIGALLALALILIDDVLSGGAASESRRSQQFSAMTGISFGSVKQAGILSSGVLKLVLYGLALLLALAPLGVNSDDMLGSLRAAFFGFQLGGVTISPSAIAGAIVLFGFVMFFTRSIQTWLESTFLPTTSLDIGLQNSIVTMLGYVGFVAGAVLGLSYLGLGLDKVTIVAGALSVGMGFGLTSIVSNFVSGLILLWERPIRVGDWIVVGEEQGKVQRINVRATQIETFDKASLIVPNSEFISGKVKNYMHANRMTRIIIPVGVSYDTDPEVIRKLLLDAALGHREVLSEPPPMVLFLSLGDFSLNFELRCFVDVDAVATTRSDLMFAIHKAIRSQKITVPFPTRTVELAEVEALGKSIAAHMPRTER